MSIFPRLCCGLLFLAAISGPADAKLCFPKAAPHGPLLLRNARTMVTEAALDVLADDFADVDKPVTFRGVALSSLAFLQCGYSMGRKPHGGTVLESIKWLVARQDRATGQFLAQELTPDLAQASAAGLDPMLDHVAATLALHEHFLVTRSFLMDRRVRKGIGFLGTTITSSKSLREWSDVSLALTQRLIVSTEFSGFWLEPAGLVEAEIKRRFGAGESSIVLRAAYVSTLRPGPECLEAATELLALANSPALAGVRGDESLATPRIALEFWLIGDALHGVAALNARSFGDKIEKAILEPVALQEKASGTLSFETRAAEILARGIRFSLTR